MQTLCVKSAVNVVTLSLLLLCGNVRSTNENSDEEKTHCKPGQYFDLLASICRTIHPKLATGTTVKARIPRSAQAECQSHEVKWPEDGKCYALTNQGPCSSSDWLVLDRKTDKPNCKKRPCTAHQVLWPLTGNCVEKESQICQSTEKLMEDSYGDGMCGCKLIPKHVFWPALNACYPMYRQGPCSPGNYLALRKQSSKYIVKCVYNECETDGMVPFEDACYELDGQKPCLSPAESLSVNSTSLVLECLLNTRNLGGTFRVLTCTEPGFQPDHVGICKKAFDFSGNAQRQRSFI